MKTATKQKERISATEARVHFGEVFRRVTENDETVIIERNGRAGAVLLSIEAYEALGGRPELDDWLQAAQRSQAAFGPFFEDQPDFDIVDMIHQMREERDEQIRDAVFGR